LNLGVSNAAAHARWAGDEMCFRADVATTTSTVNTASAAVLPLPLADDLALVSIPGAVTVSHQTFLDAPTPRATTRTVTSRATATAADVEILGQIEVGVSTDPVLTARANGRSGGAEVEWTAPLVTVSVAGNELTLPV